MRRRLIILGSTGSIGTQALAVVDHVNALHARGEAPLGLDVVGLAAGRNVRTLGEQSLRYPDARLAIAHGDVRDLAISEQGLGASFPGRLLRALHGRDSALRLVREIECDLVLAAMVGSAGLPATLAAVELGRDVALANKETLVAAGALVTEAARRSGARLLPVDSEHSAIWQCLASLGYSAAPDPAPAGVARVVLTASGGPFRTWTREQIRHATLQDALRHPTWTMGRKVTVDSASLTNKALEIIEAHWLFALPAEKIEPVVHPQSIVHAMVETRDGSVLAQLGAPDMRLPIQIALCHPHRVAPAAPRLAWTQMSRLDFEPVDRDRFRAVDHAYRVLDKGGTLGAVFNAANEAAVHAFLRGGLPFGAIEETVADALDVLPRAEVRSLDDVLEAEARARTHAEAFLAARYGRAAISH